MASTLFSGDISESSYPGREGRSNSAKTDGTTIRTLRGSHLVSRSRLSHAWCQPTGHCRAKLTNGVQWTIGTTSGPLFFFLESLGSCVRRSFGERKRLADFITASTCSCLRSTFARNSGVSLAAVNLALRQAVRVEHLPTVHHFSHTQKRLAAANPKENLIRSNFPKAPVPGPKIVPPESPPGTATPVLWIAEISRSAPRHADVVSSPPRGLSEPG